MLGNVYTVEYSTCLTMVGKKIRKGHIKLRDDVTEGYDVIPEFFSSLPISKCSSHQKTISS